MAIEQYRIWADITNPGTDQVGSTVGTSIAAGASSGLYWYLEKAGIKTGGSEDLPTTGQIYPR